MFLNYLVDKLNLEFNTNVTYEEAQRFFKRATKNIKKINSAEAYQILIQYIS